MRAIDAESPVPEPVLIERAGAAVARACLGCMGGSYGRRVVVVAGKGHNGDDGRVAASRLARRGARVAVVDAAGADRTLEPCHLVVDAAYGTGFKGDYHAPEVPPGALVVAVDIPSGVDGDTGEAVPGAVRADLTVTFAALKPGLVQGEGVERSGRVEVADIGLDPSRARVHEVEDSDVSLLPPGGRHDHKWKAALYVAGGSPGMMGAAAMCSHSAARAGAGMVRLGVPGASAAALPSTEAVSSALGASGWEGEVLDALARVKALVVGPGLGRTAAAAEGVRRLVAEAPVPVLVDADGLNALGSADDTRKLAGRRTAALLLTPHDGEYARLAGAAPGADRLGAARQLASATGASVLLKGATTVVADPDGRALVVNAGSPRLATAGTGDVLSGVAGAFLARGLGPLEALGLAAHVHGRAASLGLATGLVAGDLPELVARWLSDHAPGGGRRGG
jgi:hydroxyethylthiazole kinase-like uncharacterized protein yjeF